MQQKLEPMSQVYQSAKAWEVSPKMATYKQQPSQTRHVRTAGTRTTNSHKNDLKKQKEKQKEKQKRVTDNRNHHDGVAQRPIDL